MLQAFPVVIPDQMLGFEGTASELADRCNEALLENGLEADRGVANERLIRHYVGLNVLTSPVRRGREAIFGARQVAEFVIARLLLRDGWPLAKVAELVKSYELPVPAPSDGELAEPTPAERAIARIHAVAESPMPNLRRRATRGPELTASMGIEPLADAAQLSARRLDLADTLRSLGNPTGTTAREEVLRIRLTPWATVDIDAARLRRLGPEAAEALGKALAEALRQERLTGGEPR